ncbi:helicase domain/SNF2 family domain protein [Treponema primitia ZAS-2]|uniref:Helicase domain/SNF2 family domain protein n=1 Tax=Treponema primitia (strain ATCC BAA-887 / DSM 12427 / ZAS-2) TaxID=545694 RepID=F5YRE2_TREPZ|nr:helicase-related protein [Treponema primitia]AEF85034.1 helicase domain/SNF2 family domain protein [Treponema primitia ZAS-2]
MKTIDNLEIKLIDKLLGEIKQETKISIVASCFSIYAFEVLKKQFDTIAELRFIFSSPAFTASPPDSDTQQLMREKDLAGTEFEFGLRNKLTQAAIAKECSEWIKNKVKFYSNTTRENMPGFMVFENGESSSSYTPIQNFTTVDLGYQKGNDAYTLITHAEAPQSIRFLQQFDKLWKDSKKTKDVTDQVLAALKTLYCQNSPQFVYYITLYNIFKDYLEELSTTELPNEKTGFKNSAIWSKLYDFQREAAISIIQKLERYNGCILADSVGLGKTFTALGVIKYYESLNKSVLVLCPKKLHNNWKTFNTNNVNNPVFRDHLRYDILFHTDLLRERGESATGIDLSSYNWANNDLIVIDESHNFRNGGTLNLKDPKENRYDRLLNKVIKGGVKTKVLMLSATPVNNKFQDLNNQLKLAFEGQTEDINTKLEFTHNQGIDYIFKQAQSVFDNWSKRPPEEKTTESLLRALDFNFFNLLDSVTIARSRKHIENYYNSKAIGLFPTRNRPIAHHPALTNEKNMISYYEIYDFLEKLTLSVYMPSNFLSLDKITKYQEGAEYKNRLTLVGRELGILQLMNINLLKRLESSVQSFFISLTHLKELINNMLKKIDAFEKTKSGADVFLEDLPFQTNELDEDDENSDYFTVGKKIKFSLEDIDLKKWKNALGEDLIILQALLNKISVITPKQDNKLQTLLQVIDDKFTNPINNDNKKILIFSAFADTAEYLFHHIGNYIEEKYHLHAAMVSGSKTLTTIPKINADFNSVLSYFSPRAKTKDIEDPKLREEALQKFLKYPIDVLIGTDCISEGQNLQDCDYCINYDIHWNPVRIIQRFGRIDRIGSNNNCIQLVSFWPDLDLDEYINLKERVESKMKAVIIASTGTLEDNPIEEEKGDLEYRKAQLERLQKEVIDIEDMQTGISIMDLGLNEFRLEIQEYFSHHRDIEKFPNGLFAVLEPDEELKQGAIFILKYKGKNIDKQNRLHPYFIIYISENGEIIHDYLSSPKTLNLLKKICQSSFSSQSTPCTDFSPISNDIFDMSQYYLLLEKAISSVIDTKAAKSDVKSLFNKGKTTFLDTKNINIKDFEIISYFIIKGRSYD